MYTVTKDIDFCYGHRLMRHPGKCRHVHGHSVRATLELASATLDEQGMVCDFAELGRVARAYIDRELDHNLLLQRGDPLIPALEQGGERFLMLDEPPTAECLARMIFAAVKARGLPVVSVALWETATACAVYRER